MEDNSNPYNYEDLTGVALGKWYPQDETPEERQKRDSRPIDLRRVAQLANQRVEQSEKQQATQTPSPFALLEDAPPTSPQLNNLNDDSENEDDSDDFALNYGSLQEDYNPSKYSEFSKSLLRRMGYDIDSPTGLKHGLGTSESGIINPIQGDMSRWGTTAGLGSLSQIHFKKHVYKKPEIELSIPVQWIPRIHEDTIIMPPLADQEDFSYNEDYHDFNNPNSWAHLRVKTIAYTDPTYCEMDIQLELFGAKSKFDDVGQDQFLDARNKSNPYELLKREYFQNRAALKMAELDAECDHIFTNPECYRVECGQKPSPFYWGDVCAGPGGFSEFMSTLVKWKGKGFGFTLKAENDFQLDKFNRCSTPQTFNGYYGDGSGDVTRTSNLLSFSDEVYQGTNGQMLHVMMADGGFSVAGKENYQELLSRQLLLCQCGAALLTLRKGGVCVIKMFDNFLRFTIDCIMLMRLAFEDVAIVKPHQSRPANSERYLVCKGLRTQGGVNHPIAQYMLRVNDMMNQIDPLHQQSGLVLNADEKPLLFLSAGILSGAQLDNNEELDDQGNIVKVRPTIVSKIDEDHVRAQNKRPRRDDATPRGIADHGDDDAMDDDEIEGDGFGFDRSVFMEAYDDPFAIEFIPLHSNTNDFVEYDPNNNINLPNEIPFQIVFDPRIMPLPPEPKIDRQLLERIYEFSSTYLYTDKYKSIEKQRKLLKQQGLDNPEEESYATTLKDIIVTGQTIHSIVPMKYHDPEFRKYIRHWNESYGLQQIQWLRRVYQYIEDPSLPADDQARIRLQCLQRWKIVTDQTQESTEGCIHWNPIWNRLWCDPDALLARADLTSQRLNGQVGQNMTGIYTSGLTNQAQLAALTTGQHSMSAFTSRGGVVKHEPQRTGQMNGRQAQAIYSGAGTDQIFGLNPRYLERYKQYYNFCKYVYYNTFCIDMSFALKWIGLDLVNLPYNILFEDLQNPQVFAHLRQKLTALLTIWFKYINSQRPLLAPPTGALGDKNSILQTREDYGTASTNWAVLPVPAQAKRCLLLSIASNKKNAEFNKSLLSLVIPHCHSTITSPQNLFDLCPGLSNPSVYPKAMNPLLVQMLGLAGESFNHKDPCGDQPIRRQLLPNSKSIFQSHEIPSFVPMEPVANVFTQEFNIAKEEQFLKSNIQHDLSHDPLRAFPGDMLFDVFVNVDLPQNRHANQPQTQPQYPIRTRTLIYDAWSLPHYTEPANKERYMYEKLAYTDRYQNLNVLGDTMRVKESRPNPPRQAINSQKLAHHSKQPLTPINSNNLRKNRQGTLSSLEITRAMDIGLFLKDPLTIWNAKQPPQLPEERPRTKDNLFLIQKGHKLYSLSIWISLFSLATHPPKSLANNLTPALKQERDVLIGNTAPQSDENIGKVYSILRDLQQKSIRDALIATLAK